MRTKTKSAATSGAQILLKRCLGLGREDRFLLVYDETTLRLPQVFQAAAAAAGIEYSQTFVGRRRQADGSAFDATFDALIQRVEGILLAVSAEPVADRFRVEMADRRRGKATVGTMPGASLDIIRTAIDIDYEEITRMCRRLAVPLAKGRACLITTFDRHDRPYELHLELGGMKRMPVQSLGILPRGAWGNVPAGETFIAPLEHLASGEFLVNGAVGQERTLGSREALLTFEEGRLVKHQYLHTGRPVNHLRQLEPIARGNNDQNKWTILAEFGIGVNRSIRRIVGVELMDEKKYGTVHIAIGHNEGFGGTNVCLSVHCDMTTQAPTVTVDGHPIIERGEHVEDVSVFLDDHRELAVPDAEPLPLNSGTWRAQKEYFALDPAGRLLVIWRTASGRKTVYCPFHDETARLAGLLVGERAAISPKDLHDFSEAEAMPREHLQALLHLLRAHNVLAYAS